jgi:hypothetical protein
MHYYEDDLTLYGLVRDLFCASAITCFLWGVHRVGKGAVLKARIKALEEFGDEYAPEEREILIHRIKAESLHY